MTRTAFAFMDRRRFLHLSSLSLGALAASSVIGAGRVMAADDTTLRIIYPTLTQDWSPLRGGGQNYRLNSFWNASPLYYDEAGELHPYVFTKWTSNSDFTVWSFEIDPKAVFSDGSPITADEVKGSWEVAARPNTKNQRIEQVVGTVDGFLDVTSGASATLKGVKVTGERSLDVNLSQSDPIFFAKLANQLAPIVKASAIRDEAGDERAEWWRPENGVVSSGPYKPTAIGIDSGELVFEVNDKFFGPAPKITRIEVRSVEDAVTATALLKAGQFDVHSLLQTPTVIDDLGEDFLAGAAAPEGDFFWLNTSRPPTDDVNVRKALIQSIDIAQLVALTFPKGPEVAADQILHGVPGVDADYKGLPYDPDEARRLLAASKYGSADSFPAITIVGIARPVHEVAAQYMSEQWRTILGVAAIRTKPSIDSSSGPEQASIQIFRDNVGARVPDPIAFLAGAIASTSSNAKNKLGNYANPKVDELLAKGALEAAGSDARFDYARQAQRAFAEDAAYIPWVYRNMPKMAMPWVKGIKKNMDWQVYEPWALTVERT